MKKKKTKRIIIVSIILIILFSIFGWPLFKKVKFKAQCSKFGPEYYTDIFVGYCGHEYELVCINNQSEDIPIYDTNYSLGILGYLIDHLSDYCDRVEKPIIYFYPKQKT